MSTDLALGSDQGGPLNLKWGNQQVVAVKWGTLTLWLQPIINITVDDDNGLLADLAAWVDEIPIVGTFYGAGIGLIGKLIAFLIPDGIAATLGKVTSYLRSEAVCATDDSFVEVTVGSVGYKGLTTDVLAHYSENGSGTQGVGFRLIDSTLALVIRTHGSTVVKEGAGLYKIGDVLRFETHATTHHHELYKNGKLKAAYNDIGELTLGPGNRAVAVLMQAEIETANGARSNSPSLASLIAGDLQTRLAIPTAKMTIGVDAPLVVGGEDFDVHDVSALPGTAGMGMGARHPSSVVVPKWIADL